MLSFDTRTGSINGNSDATWTRYAVGAFLFEVHLRYLFDCTNSRFRTLQNLPDGQNRGYQEKGYNVRLTKKRNLRKWTITLKAQAKQHCHSYQHRFKSSHDLRNGHGGSPHSGVQQLASNSLSSLFAGAAAYSHSYQESDDNFLNTAVEYPLPVLSLMLMIR